jgi:phage terminase large subunit-like protein
MEMEEEVFDEDGNPLSSELVYETFQREVEDRGDGTGEFIWPRQQRKDGTWFGFNTQVLMKKKAQYLDKSQFWAQYYNDPNNAEDAFINPDSFQYFDRSKVHQSEGHWWYMKSRLNVFAAIDFAFSMSKRADFTAIVVIGIDSENNIYILDIDRFKSDRIADYYEAIHRMYKKWEFKKMRAEINVAQQSIVRELKDSYIKPNGLLLKIDEYRPQKSDGVKEERIHSTLEPRYDNQMMFHYRGGNCQLLEEELIARRPPHDDIKDALTAAVDIAVAPKINTHKRRENNVVFDSRFGGVAFK